MILFAGNAALKITGSATNMKTNKYWDLSINHKDKK